MNGWLQWISRFPALLVLGACVSSQPPRPPVIGVGVIGYAPGAESLGLASGAFVQVADATSLRFLSSAAVTINGVSLPFQEEAQAYQADLDIPPGARLDISVVVDGVSYGASIAQLAAYPEVTSPGAGATWYGQADNTVRWTGADPPAGSSLAVGVVDAGAPDGPFLWPLGGPAQPLQAWSTSTQIPAGSLTGGDRIALVGVVYQVPFAAGAEGSSVLLTGFGACPFTVPPEAAAVPSPGLAAAGIAP